MLDLLRWILIMRICDLVERPGIPGASDDMNDMNPSADALGAAANRTNLKACGYGRVSTVRQAEGELSLPEQRDAIARHCSARRWELADYYVDAGVSGTEEDRPEFQRMVERALDDDHPFDLIVVHSLSRFFRDSFHLEMYVRKLAKAGVRVVSVTQELGEDPAQVMMRQLIGMFDEYQSRENAKHVLRAMNENARQGFYNGSPVPLGYRTEEVERRGARIKKRLAVDPVEAELVKLIFRLCRVGEGASGPMGVKAIACWLNSRGYRTHTGGLFGNGAVHTILTNPVYVGKWSFNKRSSKTLREKPIAEQIVVDVPAIIVRAEFEAVGDQLKSRDPRAVAPRVVTGPILLTGLAVCGSCGAAMTLRTGTSKSGAVHRYYTCSACARQGKAACPGRSIPMAKLDTLVTEHLIDRLLHPQRLTEILASINVRRAERALELDKRVAALQTEVGDCDDKLRRLYRMVEEGVTEIDDVLKGRLDQLKTDRERAKAALERIVSSTARSAAIEPEAVEKFSRIMLENVASGAIPLRKAYIQSVVDRIEVDDGLIRIVGDKSTLEQAVAGRVMASGGVRRRVPKWRARRDSNLWPLLRGRRSLEPPAPAMRKRAPRSEPLPILSGGVHGKRRHSFIAGARRWRCSSRRFGSTSRTRRISSSDRPISSSRSKTSTRRWSAPFRASSSASPSARRPANAWCAAPAPTPR
jgi:DNA invertase Pin-like site-specific DNA recombinase